MDMVMSEAVKYALRDKETGDFVRVDTADSLTLTNDQNCEIWYTDSPRSLAITLAGGADIFDLDLDDPFLGVYKDKLSSLVPLKVEVSYRETFSEIDVPAPVVLQNAAIRRISVLMARRYAGDESLGASSKFGLIGVNSKDIAEYGPDGIRGRQLLRKERAWLDEKMTIRAAVPTPEETPESTVGDTLLVVEIE